MLKSVTHYKNDGTTIVKSTTNNYQFKPIHTEPVNFQLNLISGTSVWVDVFTEGSISSEFVYNQKTVNFLDGVTKTEHILEWRPAIYKFLALPPGYRFLLGEDDYEDVWFDESLLNIEA